VSSDADGGDAISFRRVGRGDIGNICSNQSLRSRYAPDTIAKFLFTSGSTGTPKAVINTQHMLTSSQQAKAQIWPVSSKIRRTIWFC